MKKYKKIYIDFFGYYEGEFIPSEMSGGDAVHIHHIDPRGMGGSKSRDYIENLVALTFDEHEKAEHDKEYNEQVRKKHLEFIKIKRPDYVIKY